MLSALTASISFMAPPMVHLNSMLDLLMKDVREIVGLARTAKHQQLMEFGEYVDRVVNRLVSVLQNDQVTHQTNILKNLEELQRTLHAILCQISYLAVSEGLVARTRHILFPEEDQICQMRQRLDDSLRVFQFGALIELLAQDPNQPTGPAAGVRDPNYAQAPDYSNIPSGQHRTHRRRALQAVEQAQDSVLPSPLPDSRPCTPGARPPGRSAGLATGCSPDEGKIPAAFMIVERCRRSLQHCCSPTQKKELAAALDGLAILLDRAGRTGEALAASRESTELNRSLIERVH
ncbi:unnamed protein product [Rhizoctonia solani]|uniref:Uncharacterized protein n=1 Tax=Rhizoctonia solani TaxID=456999 RepID=A0A8H3D0V1_9AGAM|nr:unnamed protein product [Rhizoctonia solani]